MAQESTAAATSRVSDRQQRIGAILDDIFWSNHRRYCRMRDLPMIDRRFPDGRHLIDEATRMFTVIGLPAPMSFDPDAILMDDHTPRTQHLVEEIVTNSRKFLNRAEAARVTFATNRAMLDRLFPDQSAEEARICARIGEFCADDPSIRGDDQTTLFAWRKVRNLLALFEENPMHRRIRMEDDAPAAEAFRRGRNGMSKAEAARLSGLECEAPFVIEMVPGKDGAFTLDDLPIVMPWINEGVLTTPPCVLDFSTVDRIDHSALRYIGVCRPAANFIVIGARPQDIGPMPWLDEFGCFDSIDDLPLVFPETLTMPAIAPGPG